jgi:hypothetical protein
VKLTDEELVNLERWSAFAETGWLALLIAELRLLRPLATAVSAWRAAECAGGCDGDNHTEECPCEIARQDLLDAHNRLTARDDARKASE